MAVTHGTVSLEYTAADPKRFDAAHALLSEHLTNDVAHESYVQAVEYDATIPRWYVRFGCEGRDAATIYFDLHPRSLHFEVYFLPAPRHGVAEVYELLLRANHDAYAVAASIGRDGEVYLVGRRLLEHLDREELDRIIGSIYEFTERWFPLIARIAFTAPGAPVA